MNEVWLLFLICLKLFQLSNFQNKKVISCILCLRNY